MNIAIIGAGPAGIISARNAIKAGHSVVLFEKNTRIGGIWNIDERSWMQMSDRVRLLGRGW